MTVISIPRRLRASALCLLLVSCGATRYSVAGPESAQQLTRYALIIEETPDGQVSHSWRSITDFDLTRYPYRAVAGGVRGRVVNATFSRNCEEERDRCERMCRASLTGRDWSHMSAGAKNAHCRQMCMQPYIDCSRLKELAEGKAVEFNAIDGAVDWVKRNKEELLVGTVVVIAGVAFCVAVGGSGGAALLLLPVVALASSEPAAGPRISSVTP
jgi:hypothetical protein